MATIERESEKVAEIVRDAGGKIVGRTKLQKVAYLLELSGLGSGFEFQYRHYGPYSEALSEATRVADAFGLIEEEERTASWGGRYSVYTVSNGLAGEASQIRAEFLKHAASMNSIDLELAATAAYLSAVEHCSDAWAETERRKPEKATRLDEAKKAYRELLQLPTPQPLPDI